MSEREVDGITITKLHGRLVLGPEAEEMQNEISRLVTAHQVRVIFDLHEISHIDSTGLGVLVLAHSRFEKAGGDLKLLRPSERHMELLILTKLTTVFEVFDEEQSAIDSFFPERQIKRFDILEFVKQQENSDASSDFDKADESAETTTESPDVKAEPG